MNNPPRVLVIAHGHPSQRSGGGEIAARSLHRTLRASGEFDSVFMACQDDPFTTHAGTAFGGAGAPAEVIFHTALEDRFLFEPARPSRLWQHFREALEIIKPDIVHFHHFLHIGLPAFDEVRRLTPHISLVLTLHEFQAICHNEGQMVKTRSGALCYGASSEACHGCFPSRKRQDFALRERHIKSWFERVDRFIAPSQFLAQRYVDWGIDASRITVLENLLDSTVDRDLEGSALQGASEPNPARKDGQTSTAVVKPHAGIVERGLEQGSTQPLKLAFFGRINSVKGVDLLLEAMSLLPTTLRDKVRLDIYGAGLEHQTLAQRLGIRKALRRSGNQVRLCGSYRSEELPALMGEADWMVMPSRWWENSPLVILEARRHGLPVICADIGGMAEKIEHGLTGLHFRNNDAHALAQRIVEVVAMGDERLEYATRIRRSSRQAEIAEAHLTLHRDLLGNKDEIMDIRSSVVHLGLVK